MNGAGPRSDQLALDHGYEQLTVEAITEAADVSVRTFFNYFSSKDDALLGADPDRAWLLAAELAARPVDESPIVALRAVFDLLAASFAERQPLWQARMAQVQSNPQLWPRMVAGFTEFERSLAEAVGQRVGCDPEEACTPESSRRRRGRCASPGALACRRGERAASRVGHGGFDVLTAGLAAPDRVAPTTGSTR